MLLLRSIALVGSVVFLSACSTMKPAETEPVQPEPREAPTLIKKLPETVESFSMQGYKYFGDGSGGYSVRYANKRKRRIADMYIYPVAKENTNLAHNQLVLGSTRATLQAIGEAAKQGHYENFNVLNAATRAQGLRTTARVQATYLRDNLASYTLVYQTEHKGTLLKIRVSMPDNDSNRKNSEWDKFADRMFKTAIRNLDRPETTPI